MWCRNYGVCLLSLLILIIFCVILTLVYSLRACHMWLTRNHMFIREIWGKFTSFIFWNFEISFVSFGRFYNLKRVNSVDLSQISFLSQMFLEWENNNRKLQIISGTFQNNAINDVKQFSLSHVIIKLMVSVINDISMWHRPCY